MNRILISSMTFFFLVLSLNAQNTQNSQQNLPIGNTQELLDEDLQNGEESPAESVAENDSPANPIKLFSAIDFNIVNVDTFETGYAYQLDVDGVYFLTEYLGVHSGLHYNNLKGSEKVTDSNFSMTYLDIPFGVTFSYNPISSSTIENYIGLGAYVGIPMSKAKLETSGSGTTEFDAKLFYGILLNNYTFFPISKSFSVGIHSYFKYGLSDIVASEDFGGEKSKYFSAGLGLAVKFL